MKTADELWDLYEQARTLPHGAAQIALVEEVIRHADTAGDPRLAFTARLLATNAYTYGGEPAKAFVTFAWALADFDRNPGQHHAHGKHTLLWHFKTMVSAMTNFPEIPLDRTRAVLDDMERRYREDGHSMQAVYKHRYLVADHVGAPEADEWFARWQAAPRDELSDCIGCDPSSVAAYYNERDRFADVIATAEPVLAGELTCSEQPQGILRELMVAYLRTGRVDDAADAHRRSYRLERGNLADLWNLGTHLAFCAQTGNEHRGLEILQRHIDWLDKAPSPAAEMHFSADAAMLLRRLTELGHGETIIHRREHGDISATALGIELAARATELAKKFDERNGTDHQSRSIAADLAAEPYEVVLPLSPTARRTAPDASTSASASGDHTFAPGLALKQDEPEVPADATAAELLDLARQHWREDRDAALTATLEALDARFPRLDDSLLAARREVMLGNRMRSAGAGEHWARAVELFDEVVAGVDGAAASSAPTDSGDANNAGAESGPDAADGSRVADAAREASALRARTALDRGYSGEPVDEAPVLADVTYQEQHGGAFEQANAWARLSILHLMNGRLDEANEAGDRSDELAAQTGDPRMVAMHTMLRARNRMAAHRHDEALTAAREAWEFYRAEGPGRRIAEAGTILGHALDDPAEQVEVFSAVIATGEPEKSLPARLGRGNALLQLGRPDEAIVDLVEAVALCAEGGLDVAGAHARNDLANAYRLAGRPVEGAEVAEEALARFEQLEDDDAADNARYLLAGLYRQIGDPDGALILYRTLIERLDGNPAGRGQIAEDAAGLLFDMDRDAEAAETFLASASALHESGDPIGELRALRRAVGALHYADQPERGLEVIEQIGRKFDELPPELAAEPNAIFQRSMTAYEAGNLLMSRGRYEEALPHLSDAPERLTAIGAIDQADRLEGMRGEALLRSGRAAEAEALLRALLERMPADSSSRDLAERVHEEAVAAADGRSTS
ncbi:tetratricopeptide repeat protein [Paractinoplanes lichenicola]|uniref:Tetratricopeptide repeat protein n=1 Tax=Paractinoplanes lichenicola TaxID=2802976 RepID=A0ABS1W226_9ACTN|nr:tetratricopeptide repeat protein [Actinoplanes lichenicola]MBL7260795.1 tetratricopeptide repeat protein [Actinoplanes lichenicola]